jgi:tyrosyl-tRNA synthetase
MAVEIFHTIPEQIWSDLADSRLGSHEGYLANLESKLCAREYEDLSRWSAKDQHRLLTSRCYTEFPLGTRDHGSELLNVLEQSKQSGIPLIVKFGIDPTGSDVHIGHAEALRNAVKLVRMGHNLQMIFGGYTATIGDPSDRKSGRVPLSREQVETNMQSYWSQIAPMFPQNARGKVLDPRSNADWLPLKGADIDVLARQINVSELLARDDFKVRLAEGNPISLSELLYAIYTGYDSVVINADIELVGQDQLKNTFMARKVQEILGQRPEAILASHLLPGTDGLGRKMSKSLNNYIPIKGDPNAMFASVMNMVCDLSPIQGDGNGNSETIQWGLLRMYLEQYSDIDDLEWVEIEKRLNARENPMHPDDVKVLIARMLVRTFHGEEAVEEAQAGYFGNLDALSSPEVRLRVFHENMNQAGGVINSLVNFNTAEVRSLPSIMRLIEEGLVQLYDNGGNIIGKLVNTPRTVISAEIADAHPGGTFADESQFKAWLFSKGYKFGEHYYKKRGKYYLKGDRPKLIATEEPWLMLECPGQEVNAPSQFMLIEELSRILSAQKVSCDTLTLMAGNQYIGFKQPKSDQ